MRTTLTVLALVSALSAPGAYAQVFDPSQCARIQDVDVPYEVTQSSGAITFSSRGGAVVVDAQSIRANGQTHASPAVASYHQALSQFLNRADTMGREGLRAANPLARRDNSLGDAATNMCSAILELARSSAVIEGEFTGYSSPVRIRLR